MTAEGQILLLGDSITHTMDPNTFKGKTKYSVTMPGREKKHLRCYTTKTGSRFPSANYYNNTDYIINKYKPRILVLQASTNDISDIGRQYNREWRTQVEQAKNSSRDIISLAEECIYRWKILERIVIVARPPRIDQYRNLRDIANDELYRSKYGNEPYYKQITIASHWMPYNTVGLFGHSNQADGIHLKGKNGQEALTNSFLRIFEENNLTERY